MSVYSRTSKQQFAEEIIVKFFPKNGGVWQWVSIGAYEGLA